VVKKDLHGKLLVEGDKDHPVNKGMLCSKGMNLHYTVMDQQDRLLYLNCVIINLPRQRVSWDQALDKAAGCSKPLLKNMARIRSDSMLPGNA
jgi:ferredoxin-nitrate reductase